MAEKAPTYEEFAKAVKDDFARKTRHSREEVEEYFSRQEIKDIIKQRYEADYRRFERGELSANVFRIGCVSSVSYCLDWLYE